MNTSPVRGDIWLADLNLSGVREQSFIKCEDVRSISTERLTTRWGAVSPAVMQQVEDCLRILMGL